MEVLVVGGDPVLSAVRAALGDIDTTVREGEAAAVETSRFAVVSGLAGAAVFETATAAARAGDTPWFSVEIGGVGGHPLEDVDAAISGFAPDSACFRCLATRVGATVTDTAETPSADRSAARLAGAIAGREAVRLFAGETPSLVGRTIELPHEQRSVLPVPGCQCGGGRTYPLGDDAETLSLEETVERVEGVIDDRVGLITDIGEVESFPAPYYLASVTDTEALSDAEAATEAAGVDAGWNAALVKAVGEGLERYCAAIYRHADFVSGQASDVARAVSPRRFVRPTDWTDQPTSWIDAENLATGASVRIPADQVVFPPSQATMRPAITTGLGLGSSTVDALIAGLTEVIERDATMLAWYSTYEPLGLDIADEAFHTLARRAGSEGLAVTPLLVTQDIDVPVVTVAVHREPDDWPAFAVGSAASLDPESAARSALAEALQNWMELRELGHDAATDASGAIGRYGQHPAPSQALVEPSETVPIATVGPESPPNGRAALDMLVDACQSADLTPYAVGLTTRDVAAVDLSVVRVVVPAAQPLFTGDPYFGDRARTVPESLGFAPSLDRPFHPYP